MRVVVDPFRIFTSKRTHVQSSIVSFSIVDEETEKECREKLEAKLHHK